MAGCHLCGVVFTDARFSARASAVDQASVRYKPLLDTLDHRPYCIDFGRPQSWRRFDIDDDAGLHIDEIVGRVGVKRRATQRRSSRSRICGRDRRANGGLFTCSSSATRHSHTAHVACRGSRRSPAPRAPFCGCDWRRPRSRWRRWQSLRRRPVVPSFTVQPHSRTPAETHRSLGNGRDDSSRTKTRNGRLSTCASAVR